MLEKCALEGAMKVSDVMTKQPVVCLKSDSATSVAALMKLHDIGSVPVVSDLTSRKMEGIVTDRDLCVRLVAENANSETTQIGSVMTRNPVTCSASETLEQCEALMRDNKVRRIPVVDQRGSCVGIVAQADVVLRDTSDGVGQMLAAVSTPRTGGFVGAHIAA
jgi:signal-transduction protein with cAMP-binding, CBS, and nucleotidyltransferase domain